MKTYRDLINYAETLPKTEIEFWENQLERIFDLGYDTLLSIDSTPRLYQAEVVDEYIYNRAYVVSVIYFDDEPFCIYSMGGRSYNDHESIRVVDKDVWEKARSYVLSLKVESDNTTVTSLDDYIEREYAGYFPWEYLDAKPVMYKASSKVYVNGVEEFTMNESFYTPETALERLRQHQEFFKQKIGDTADITFDEPFVE